MQESPHLRRTFRHRITTPVLPRHADGYVAVLVCSIQKLIGFERFQCILNQRLHITLLAIVRRAVDCKMSVVYLFQLIAEFQEILFHGIGQVGQGRRERDGVGEKALLHANRRVIQRRNITVEQDTLAGVERVHEESLIVLFEEDIAVFQNEKLQILRDFGLALTILLLD